MTLNDKQHIFAMNLSRLLQHVESLGLTCSVGEIFRTPEQAEIYAKQGKGIKDSLHCKKLAADIFLFANGKLLQKKEDYKLLGDYWKSLHALNRWGGDFVKLVDSVHFEMQDI
jgi:hypothetical protein